MLNNEKDFKSICITIIIFRKSKFSLSVTMLVSEAITTNKKCYKTHQICKQKLILKTGYQ